MRLEKGHFSRPRRTWLHKNRELVSCYLIRDKFTNTTIMIVINIIVINYITFRNIPMGTFIHRFFNQKTPPCANTAQAQSNRVMYDCGYLPLAGLLIVTLHAL